MLGSMVSGYDKFFYGPEFTKKLDTTHKSSQIHDKDNHKFCVAERLNDVNTPGPSENITLMCSGPTAEEQEWSKSHLEVRWAFAHRQTLCPVRF